MRDTSTFQIVIFAKRKLTLYVGAILREEGFG